MDELPLRGSGEVIESFSHGPGITLLLDSAEAFTGDLLPLQEYGELARFSQGLKEVP